MAYRSSTGSSKCGEKMGVEGEWGIGRAKMAESIELWLETASEVNSEIVY